MPDHQYRNILLVDDDPGDCEIFRASLRQVNEWITCMVTTNGRVALLYLNSCEVRPDLIFLDLNMPVMDGRLFLKTYHAIENNPIPIIILTTSTDHTANDGLLKMGARQVIIKPPGFEEMKNMLRRIFTGHTTKIF